MSRWTDLLVFALLVVATVAVVPGLGAADAGGEARDQLSEGHVLAQVEGENNSTTSATKEVVKQVDEDVRILSYGFIEKTDTMVIEIENTGDATAYLSVTEAIGRRQASSGSTTFAVRQIRIADGETVKLRMQLQADRPLGVMVVTDRSLKAGTGEFLPAETDGSLLDGAATWADARAVGFAMALFGLIGGLLTAWAVVSKKHQPWQEVEVGR